MTNESLDTRKLLVVYASRLGSTAEIAKVIGEKLRGSGAAVDVRSINEVRDVTPYDAVVFGSAIRVGQWLPEAIQFLQTHYRALSQRPVAYFVVCLTMSNDTPENRRTVMGYIQPVLAQLPAIKPVDIGLFAGAFEAEGVPLLVRWMRRIYKLPVGDFRKWAAIRDWAARVSVKLTSRAEALP